MQICCVYMQGLNFEPYFHLHAQNSQVLLPANFAFPPCKDGEDIMKVWDEGRKLLMKGKEVRNSDRMPIPGCSIYRRKHQMTDRTDLTTAYQRAERDESEK